MGELASVDSIEKSESWNRGPGAVTRPSGLVLIDLHVHLVVIDLLSVIVGCQVENELLARVDRVERLSVLVIRLDVGDRELLVVGAHVRVNLLVGSVREWAISQVLDGGSCERGEEAGRQEQEGGGSGQHHCRIVD